MQKAASIRLLAIASIFIMILSATSISGTADAAETTNEITVTDGMNITHKFAALPEHVVSVGLGTTEVMISIGSVEKIVVTDKYSYTTGKEYDKFKRFVEKCDAGEITHAGSAYSSSWPDLRSAIYACKDFDKNNDAIFVTYTGDTSQIYSDLMGEGYKHVLRWEKPSSYESILSFVEAASMVTLGEKGQVATQMREMVNQINEKFIEHPEWQNKNAFYVTYSGSQFKVGNVGSIGTAILQAAHLNVVTIDTTRSESTYAADLTYLIEKYGKDTMIFADESSITTQSDKLISLRDQVGKEVKIYSLNYLWNNYSVESAKGTWAIACTAYHEYDESFFDANKVLTPLVEQEESMPLFIAAGIIVSVIVIGVTYYLSRD